MLVADLCVLAARGESRTEAAFASDYGFLFIQVVAVRTAEQGPSRISNVVSLFRRPGTAIIAR